MRAYQNATGSDLGKSVFLAGSRRDLQWYVKLLSSESPVTVHWYSKYRQEASWGLTKRDQMFATFVLLSYLSIYLFLQRS